MSIERGPSPINGNNSEEKNTETPKFDPQELENLQGELNSYSSSNKLIAPREAQSLLQKLHSSAEQIDAIVQDKRKVDSILKTLNNLYEVRIPVTLIGRLRGAQPEQALRQAILEALERQLPEIEKRYIERASGSQYVNMKGLLVSLRRLAESDDPRIVRKAYNTWRQAEKIAQEQRGEHKNKISDFEYGALLGTFAQSADPEIAQDALADVDQLWVQGEKEYYRGHEGIKTVLNSKRPEAVAEGRKLLQRRLEQTGLPVNVLLTAWEQGGPPTPGYAEEGWRKIIINFDEIQELEKRRPGAARVLFEEFGIRMFGRYGWETLVAQYDNHKDTDKPFGIVLYPISDHNGAFYQDVRIIDSLREQLEEQGYLLRIVEAGSKFELGRRLVGLDKQYGNHHKISFAVIGGHGTTTSIQFGGNDPKHLLMAEDLHGTGIRRSGKFFEDHPTIILASCSTGARRGIGQQLSKTLGATVIAPDKPTSLGYIYVKRTVSGSLELSAKYTDDDTRQQYTAGSKS